jgi:hypothetical protein
LMRFDGNRLICTSAPPVVLGRKNRGYSGQG